MGNKGQSSQTQTGTSTYTPNSQILGAGSQALSQAQTAASSPFQLPVAPVAGFTGDQSQAFQQTRDAQGMAQPYYNQAQGLFQQSAAPITGQQVSNYMNPYAGYVMGNLAEQQGQQMNDLTGKATQTAGGVGADRIGVAQGELARQQNLASGQTLSGIYGNALSAAQQNAQMQQSAAYGIGNLGGAAQNASLQGTNALYGMGSQQQQLNQAQLNAPYQNQLAQIAYPYQNAQYLAGITGSLAGAMGGTTNSNQYGTATPAQPSPWSQLLGAGTSILGGLGSAGAFNVPSTTDSYGGGSAAAGDAYGGSAAAPLPGLSASDYGGNSFGFARGGSAFAAGGDTGGEPAWMTSDPTIPTIAMHASQVNQPKVQPMTMSGGSGGGSGSDIGSTIGSIAKTAATFLPMLLATGGAVSSPYRSYTEGQNTFDERYGNFAPQTPSPYPVTEGALQRHAVRRGYAAGGPTIVSGAGSSDQPYRMPDVNADGSPIVPPDTMNANDTSDSAIPANAAPAEGTGTPKPTTMKEISPYAGQIAEENAAAMKGTKFDAPYGDIDPTNDVSRKFAKSPWLALMNAGFGMMAGTSPYAGVNIGKGLQEGVKTLEGQRKSLESEEGVNQRAKQLAMQADQHLREWTQLTPKDVIDADYKKKALENQAAALENKGWQKGETNILTGDTPWIKHTDEGVISGVLKADGTWVQKNGAATATPSPTVTPPPDTPAPTPTPDSPASTEDATPPPYGVKEFASNLEPSESNIKYLGKTSPLGKANEKELNTVIPIQQKARAQLHVLEQDISAMKYSFKTLTKDADKDGFISRIALQPGADFGDRLEKAKMVNAADVAAGRAPSFDPEKIAAAENINKIQSRMGLTFASQISPREAFSGQKIGIASTPGLANTPQGFRRLIAGFEANVNNLKDEHKFFQKYIEKNKGVALGWQQDFENKNPQERYVVSSLIGSLPEYNQKHIAEDVKALQNDPSPKNIKLFNEHYADTANFFLGGK